jgi:Tfp pilus assembly protein PilV
MGFALNKMNLLIKYFRKIKTSILKDPAEGLTIVEALVSLMVLTLGLLPTLSVITSSLNIAAKIRDNLIAANLAQEGIEVTRSLRDANWFLDKPNFYDGLIDPITETATWRVDWNTSWAESNLPQSVTQSTNPNIKYDPGTGRYNYSTGNETTFKRYVTVTLSTNPCNCELIVVSTVEWLEKTRPRSLQTESHLYDWR